MSQPSVACYFTNRKRSAIDELKLNKARKCLKLDNEVCISRITTNLTNISETKTVANTPNARRIIKTSKSKQPNDDGHQKDIKELFGKMAQTNKPSLTGPPTTPPKQRTSNDLNQIKKKLSRSSRLAELKASISRFNKCNDELKQAEEKTAQVSQAHQAQSPKLKSFKTIEIHVPLSPQKVQSPEKAYLSPKKEPGVRRNLLNSLTPTKNLIALPESPSKQILESTLKPALKLPVKYLCLLEMFGAIDVVTQILYNRKECVTFKKLKPGVEKMIKRNLLERHLAQIKHIYPESYKFSVEKMKVFGSGSRQEEWQLILTPCTDSQDNQEKMTEAFMLNRKRTLSKLLLDKVKMYHDEFLQSLTPPMIIPKDKITRWHQEFDIEKVPDIETANIPQPPLEETLTGKQVLERARQMFNCNTRMEQALARLQSTRESQPAQEEPQTQPESILKGIPKALLEKVRQKQAAKALLSMTRSADKDKEVQLYSRLPEIARITRNLFVAEKKSVLHLDCVLEKLENSYRSFLTKADMESHLRTISTEVPHWLIFLTIRNCVYIKLAKSADLSLVLCKLENLAKQKNAT